MDGSSGGSRSRSSLSDCEGWTSCRGWTGTSSSRPGWGSWKSKASRRPEGVLHCHRDTADAMMVKKQVNKSKSSESNKNTHDAVTSLQPGNEGVAEEYVYFININRRGSKEKKPQTEVHIRREECLDHRPPPGNRTSFPHTSGSGVEVWLE